MDRTTQQHAETSFTRYLESRRLRKTPERYAILNALWGIRRHFQVEELHTAMEQSGYHVSLTTVYNTLELLCGCGILRRHTFGKQARYEIALGNHLHLICNVCGKVRDARDEEIFNGISGRKYAAFTPAYCSIYLYGLCSACSRKLSKSERNKKQTNDTKPKTA